MNHCTFFGSYFSVSTFIAFINRLIADSWSELSRIWKDCGSPASRQCVRSSRLASPWKVPTHMPRVLIGSMAEMRVSISFAALLVKVTARMPCGGTIRQPIADYKGLQMVKFLFFGDPVDPPGMAADETALPPDVTDGERLLF